MNKYLKLFTSTFKISACTFGGGFVIVPLLKKKFVDELNWIGDEEMIDYAAIAQSSPGAIAVNASILVGYHVAGFTGAMISILGTILPPLIIISVISMFYQAFRDNIIVSMAMTGMLAGVAAVIIDVTINMIHNLFNTKEYISLCVIVGSFIATRYLKVNILIIILVCGIIGLIKQKIEKKDV